MIRIFFLNLLVLFFFFGCAAKDQAVIKEQQPEVVVKTEKQIEKEPLKEEVIKEEKKIQPPLAIEQEKPHLEEKPEPVVDTQEVIEEKEEEGAGVFKLAFIYSQKIPYRYIYDFNNISLDLAVKNSLTVEIEYYKMDDESLASIEDFIVQSIDKGYKEIVLFSSELKPEDIADIYIEDDVNIYLPLQYKKEDGLSQGSIIYGGLDYGKQFSKLLEHTNEKITVFSDESFLSHTLTEVLKNMGVEFEEKKINTLTKHDFRFSKRLNNSTIILNTPLIKSSILLSQLRAHEIKPFVILSTQVNYSPLILSTTQPADRRNTIFANSISKLENSSILDYDISYNWVNFSLYRGLDQMMKNSLAKEEMTLKNISYEVELYKALPTSFIKIEVPE